MHSFAVVPPMSKESTSPSPRVRAKCAARIAPPAGPDSTSRTGAATAVASVASPPLEVMRRNGHENPAFRSESARPFR